MKKMWKNVLSLLLALSLTVSITGCGSQEAVPGTENAQTEGAESADASASDGEKIINIGVTDSLGGVNPFVIDQTEINKYAVGLMFLPLMELDSELNFVGMLADSVTTEDNLNFTVHINDEAVWSDGTPVTAADVEFTVRRLASPVVNNTTLMLYAFEGIGDDGFVTAGAESIDGIQIIDDKTVRFTSKNPMALTTFENTYARYIHTLPKHIIENFSEEELLTTEWFNKPDVINGPDRKSVV